MLWNRWFAATALAGLLSAQSMMNALGFGSMNSTPNPAAVGTGSLGLLPIYKSGVAQDNPATWPNLHYTYLQIAYGGNLASNSANNWGGLSGLNSAQLVIPVKQKQSLGIGVRPYSTQHIELLTPEDSTINLGSYQGFGGVNAISFSLGYRINEFETIGTKYSTLFGSTRRIQTIDLEGKTYNQTSRFYYSGSLLDIYGTSTRFLADNKGPAFYGHFGLAVNPVRIKELDYFPFEDNNHSGFHDIASIAGDRDFPLRTDVPGPDTTIFNNISKPSEVGFGMDWSLNREQHIQADISYQNLNPSGYDHISPIGDGVASRLHLGTAYVQFPKTIVRSAIDHFNFRSGLFLNRYTLENNRKTIVIEEGMALGFSFIFGVTNNQIDFSVQFGRRDGLPEFNQELFANFAVGISLGDIWFVKRREL